MLSNLLNLLSAARFFCFSLSSLVIPTAPMTIEPSTLCSIKVKVKVKVKINLKVKVKASHLL